MSYIEVDQSGKVEQFDRDTVIALSNNDSYSVFLPKSIKQELFTTYKSTVDNLRYKLFSISLFFCLKDFVDEEKKIVICTEYTGKEMMLKSEILRLFKIKSVVVDPKTISFGIIGKHSPAHELAISVFRKNVRPNYALSKKDIEELLK